MRKAFVGWAAWGLLSAGLWADGMSGHFTLRLQANDGWGGASKADVKKVLYSAAQPLLRQFPGQDLAPIDVRSRGGPIVWYKRAPEDGAYTVCLDVGGTYWSRYAYQFSHELCHILCRYREGKNPNKWFEEALCEMASIYSLREMGNSWKTKPPYPNWKSYAGSLTKYAQDLIDKTERPEEDLGVWYAQEKGALRRKADLRDKNRVVAVHLLPLFEAHPGWWESLAALNRFPSHAEQSLEAYLRNWHRATPGHLQDAPVAVLDAFGLAP